MTAPVPRLLEFDGPGGVRPYAHHYRFGAAGQPAPLVVYIGGAISRAVYEERRRTTPDRLALACAAAASALQVTSVDLLVIPCPAATGESGPDWILEHLDDDLEPALGVPRTGLGCVGYSAGAGYATHLAVLAEAKALAVLGGAGLGRTIGALRPQLEARVRDAAEPLPALWLMNDHDDAGLDVAWLNQGPASLRFERRVGPGAHAFDHYEANGFVRAAFHFVLQRSAEE